MLHRYATNTNCTQDKFLCNVHKGNTPHVKTNYECYIQVQKIEEKNGTVLATDFSPAMVRVMKVNSTTIKNTNNNNDNNTNNTKLNNILFV